MSKPSWESEQNYPLSMGCGFVTMRRFKLEDGKNFRTLAPEISLVAGLFLSTYLHAPSERQ